MTLAQQWSTYTPDRFDLPALASKPDGLENIGRNRLHRLYVVISISSHLIFFITHGASTGQVEFTIGGADRNCILYKDGARKEGRENCIFLV